MNPVDHPLSGGEGKSSGGRHPTSPGGKEEGRTRQTGNPSDEFIVRRRPSFLPRGLVGWRPPEDFPSPPPSGWSTGFMATPRTDGRLPRHRALPAFPSETSSCSGLPTVPTVARQIASTSRISPDGRRSVANRPSLATSWTLVPAERAILAPAPGFSSTA